MRILIVEDEKKLIDILQRTLRAEGYIVDGVNSASDGLDFIKTYHYDLVILDLQLPDGTGTGLLKRLRGVLPSLCPGAARRGPRDGRAHRDESCV